MKLLIDEMWPPVVAAQLRERGHDAASVAERADLRGLPDPMIYVAAQSEARVVVTENVADFRPLVVECIAQGKSHAGIIFTSNRRFPRGDSRTLGRLVQALDGLIVGRLDLTGLEYWLQ